jgi:ubiquinone biosynthesis protein COQ9
MHPIDTNTAPKTSQQIQNQSQLKMNPTAAIKIMALTAQIAFALLLIFEIWMLFKIGDKMN